MAITNLYPNLPAHLVQFKDGGLTVTENVTQDQSGKSLLLLGTAVDGPVNEPVQIDATTVAKIFGDEVDSNGIANGATLTKYAKQAFKAGFHDVRCMRVTGKQAETKITRSRVEDTEEIEKTDTITIPSNSETVITLNGPIVPTTLMVKVDDKIKTPSYSCGAGTVTFRANEYRAYGDVHVDYLRYDISEKTVNVEVLGEHEEATGNEIAYIDLAAIRDALAADEDLDFSVNSNGIETGSDVLYYTNSELLGDGYDDPDNGKIKTNSYGTNGLVSVKDATNNDVEFTSVNDTDGKIAKIVFGIYDNSLHTEEGSNVDDQNNLNIPDGEVDGEGNLNLDEDSYVNITPGTTLKVTVYIGRKEQGGGDGNYTLNGTYEDIVYAPSFPITEGSLEIVGIDDLVEGTDYEYNEEGIRFNRSAALEPGPIQIAYTTTVEHIVDESFVVRSIYGGEIYNGATVEFARNANNTMRVKFTKPAGKMVATDDLPFYYDTPLVGTGESSVRTVGQLRDAIEGYAYNNVFEIVCDDDDLELETFPEGTYTLAGGTSGVGVSMDDMFKALSGTRYTQEDVDNGEASVQQIGYLKEQGAYQILENYNVDFIIPVGVYADVVPPSAKAINTTFHQELAMVCAVLTYRTKMTHGFIDVKPNTNTTLKGVQAYVDTLLKYNNMHYMSDQDGAIITDEDGNPMDIGWYTSIVVGPDPIFVSDKLGRYYGSAAIAYAALCSSIAAESAPTNKQIPGAVGMRYTFSNKQLDSLVGNRMVVFKIKNANAGARNAVPYCVDGCTAGGPNCDYKRISTVKVVTDVVDQIREVCEPFLGEPNTIEQRNAMSALISKRLMKIAEDGEITFYEFQVDATIEEVLLGECSITLTLAVPQELRKITTTVALRASA